MIHALSTQPWLLGIDWLDPETLLRAGGWLALILACAFVFLETGVVVLSFLPGDSLLFTVGLFTATGIIDVPLWLICLLLFICAFAGDQLGFTLGRTIGPAIFKRPKSRFFNPANVERTHAFFEKHGPKAIIIARFLPIIRGFVPPAAGIGHMSYRRFVVYNAVGGLLWAVGVTLLGYYLGQIPLVQQYSEVFIIVLVLIPGIPILLELWRGFAAWRAARRAGKDAAGGVGTDDGAELAGDASAELAGDARAEPTSGASAEPTPPTSPQP